MRIESMPYEATEDLQGIYGSRAEVEAAQNMYESDDMVKLARLFLDENIPEGARKHPIIQKFWGLMSKSIVLSFLDANDIPQFEAYFEQAKIKFLMSVPPYEYGFEEMQLFDQVKLYWVASIRRAKGADRNRLNERVIQGGQLHHIIRTNTEGFSGGGGGGGGFFSKIRNIF